MPTTLRIAVLLALVAQGLPGPSLHAQARPIPVRAAWAALGVDLRLTVDYFDIRGRTLAEAQRSLAQEGPTASDGSPSHAITHYVLRESWTVEREAESCRVSAASVIAEIRILLPRWEGAREATEPDYTSWRTAQHELIEHEYAHRDLALTSAWQLADELKRLEAHSCPALDHKIHAVTYRVEEALRRAQEDLDEPILRSPRRSRSAPS